ncbi:MAG TPA: hypothetical protein VGJ70_00110 [Solirubrobacteraceae bacterium]
MTVLRAANFDIQGPGLDWLPAPRRRLGKLILGARVAWRAPRLDRDLAAGVPPDCDELHAARALQLLSPRRRRQLAAGLETVVRLASTPPTFDARAPLQRAAIRAERHALLDLAARLLAPRPVSAQGVAIASLILSEPQSPLHEVTAPGAIEALALTALTALEHLA